MNNLIKELSSLCFFRNIFENKTLKRFLKLLEGLNTNPTSSDPDIIEFYKFRSEVADFTLKHTHPLAETAWKNFILDLILQENPTTLALEKDKNFMFAETLLNDLKTLSSLYNYKFDFLIGVYDPDSPNIFNKNIYDVSTDLSKSFDDNDPTSIINNLKETLQKNGLGIFKDNKVFRIENSETVLVPVRLNSVKPFNEIVGYNSQKEQLIRNTQAFIDKKGGLNVLLYGDLGTGKSTMIKALTKEFENTPLRFVEIKKNELDLIPRLNSIIRETNYPFILFIDDLSFDDGDESYRDLKIALEGSFEEFPENLLIYATSNKRKLISQRKSEREDAVNAREIMEEKNSLVSRFGLNILFSVPKQESYLKIVEFLANQNGIRFSDELKEKAIQWELRHMNRSGRTAEQFIQYILADYK